MPHIDKIVGAKNEDEKELASAYLAGLFQNNREQQGIIEEIGEVEKTETDIKTIELVKKYITEYMEKFNRKILDLPLYKIHILKEGSINKLSEGNSAGGIALIKEGSIFVDKNDSDIQLALVIFHEWFHLQSFKTLRIKSIEEKPDIKGFRSGFAVYSQDTEIVYFYDINEAITSLAERAFYYNELSKNPLFEEKIKNGYEPEFSRDDEVIKLLKLIKELYKKNKDKGITYEKIVNLFIDAQINGRLLKIARLIEDTYGKGSFRELAVNSGMMTSDIDNSIQPPPQK